MKNLLLIAILAVAALSCRPFGQFEEDVNTLAEAWEERTAELEGLLAQVEAAQTRIEAGMDTIPIRTGLIGHFGEDYLSRTDQLSARLVGHKGRFDELADQVRNFAGEWTEQTPAVQALRQGLDDGLLPRNVPDRIHGLRAALTDAGEKITAWERTLEEVTGQWEAVARQMAGQ